MDYAGFHSTEKIKGKCKDLDVELLIIFKSKETGKQGGNRVLWEILGLQVGGKGLRDWKGDKDLRGLQ